MSDRVLAPTLEESDEGWWSSEERKGMAGVREKGGTAEPALH